MLIPRTAISKTHVEAEFMTVKIPPENLLDKLLKLLGKKRQVIIPSETGKIYKDKGPYVQIKGRREGFFKALFRRDC